MTITRPRLLVGTAVAAAIAALTPESLPWHTRALFGFDSGVLLFLISCIWMMTKASTKTIRQKAKTQDEGKWAILIFSVVAATASLLAIGFEIHGVKELDGAQQMLHVGVAAATILLSWFFMHMIFALHYAHEHFLETGKGHGIKGGLVFPGEEEPTYIDFLYFSFVIGMTCQTSDVGVASHEMRRLVLIQGVLAFFFNTVVLALTINLAAGLI